MQKKSKSVLRELMVPVLMAGAVWGIFQAIVGCLLYLLPIRIGFLVWYSIAVFFLMTAYQTTGQKPGVLTTAALYPSPIKSVCACFGTRRVAGAEYNMQAIL